MSSPKNNVALITGASNGIGLELARIHAEKGGDLVIVARSEDKLNTLKSELESQHGVSVRVIAKDLSSPTAAQEIFDATEAEKIEVEILINNAGFGGHGKFYERELSADEAMMQVNMVTLTQLTHLYLKGMVARNSGKILHVASTAAFMPGPLQAVYYATKSYVVSFSQAIAQELKDTNITSTSLCPGAVATGFVEAGNLDGVDLWKNAKSARSVAECGYKGMQKGELVTFNEGSLKFMLNWVIPFMPRGMVLKTSEDAMLKK